MGGRLSAACLVFALAWHPPLLAQSPAAAMLPPTLNGSGEGLQLVSCGVRDSLWIDHYAAGLYMPRGADIHSARNTSRAKGVIIRMINMRYLPEQIPVKWLDALERTVPPAPLNRLRRAYRSLDDGDLMSIVYEPANGITIRVNRRLVTQVSGHDAIDAILQAWAEDRPVSEKLGTLSGEHPC